MDAKDTYSSSVQEQKAMAQNDAELSRNIKQGEKRKAENVQNWKSVNINDVIERFAPGIKPKVSGNKVEWFNPETQISIVADIGGGYLRIQDKSKPYRSYFDLNGQNMNNFTDQNGKQHGRPKKEREALTHFRIYYRSEM